MWGDCKSHLVFANVRDFRNFTCLPSLCHKHLAGMPNHFRKRPSCLGRSCSCKIYSLQNLDEDIVILVMF